MTSLFLLQLICKGEHCQWDDEAARDIRVFRRVLLRVQTPKINELLLEKHRV